MSVPFSYKDTVIKNVEQSKSETRSSYTLSADFPIFGGLTFERNVTCWCKFQLLLLFTFYRIRIFIFYVIIIIIRYYLLVVTIARWFEIILGGKTV